MFIELLSKDIPVHWNVIKTAGIKSDGIESELQDEYGENLLIELLSGKKRCALRFNENKELICVFLFELYYNKLAKIKYIKVTNAYGVKKQDMLSWQETKRAFDSLCKKYECKGFVANVSNERMRSVLENLGFNIHSYTMRFFLEE